MLLSQHLDHDVGRNAEPLSAGDRMRRNSRQHPRSSRAAASRTPRLQRPSRKRTSRCSTPLALVLSLLGEDLSQGLLTRLKRDRRRQISEGSSGLSHQSRITQCFHAAQMRWNYARDEPATISDIDDLPRRSSLDDLRRVLLQGAHCHLLPSHVRQCSTASATFRVCRIFLDCYSHHSKLRNLAPPELPQSQSVDIPRGLPSTP